MASKSMFRTKSRKVAFILLLTFGGFVMLLGLLLLAIGLAVTHNDKFHDGIGLKEQIESTIDYVQYWIGIPYVLTGLSITCSAVNLRKVALIVITILMSLICVVLSIAGLVVDGPDFVMWKIYRAKQRYWEGQDGYACMSTGETCGCTNGTVLESIVDFTNCGTLSTLTSIYGILIGCFIVGLVLLLACVFVIVYVVSSKRERERREGSVYCAKQKAIQAQQTEAAFDNLVVDDASLVGRRGHEYRVASEAAVTPVSTMPSRKYKSTHTDSLSQKNDERNSGSISSKDGIVMMDPGRFTLGDDDIY